MAVGSRIWMIDGQKVLNPAKVAETAREEGWPMGWWGKANSVSCPRGRHYGEAHFLVTQETINSLNLAGPLQITCKHEGGTTTWSNYYAIKTQTITRDKAKPVHWITLADKRWLLERSATEKRFNLRNAKGTSGYITATTDGGTAWTWSQVLSELWDELPAEAGAIPSISPPASTPENLVFDGMSAWQAINQVLTAIGFAVCYDPLSDTLTFANLSTRASQTLSGMILWEFRPESLPEVNYPAEVKVTFVGVPGEDLSQSPFLPPPEFETVSLGQSGLAGTQWPILDTMFSWDDNSTERTARADEIKDALVGLLYPLANPWGVVYGGIVEAVTDSDITEVLWTSDGARGMRTVVKTAFQEIDWPKLPEFVSGGGGGNIEYTITTVTTESGGLYIGLKKASVVVRVGPGNLIGTTVDVIDHSNCIFDEADMAGYTGWAFWGQAWGLSGDCETLTPYHWCAINRCCDPNTGTYAEPCP